MTLGFTVLIFALLFIIMVILDGAFNYQVFVCSKCKTSIRKHHRYIPLFKIYKCNKCGSNLKLRG